MLRSQWIINIIATTITAILTAIIAKIMKTYLTQTIDKLWSEIAAISSIEKKTETKPIKETPKR